MVKNAPRPQRPPGQPEDLRDGAPTPDPARRPRPTPPRATERPNGQPPTTKGGPATGPPPTEAYKAPTDGMVKNAPRPQRPPGQPEDLRDGAPTPDPARRPRPTPPRATERPNGQPPTTKGGPATGPPPTEGYEAPKGPDGRRPTEPVDYERPEKTASTKSQWAPRPKVTAGVAGGSIGTNLAVVLTHYASLESAVALALSGLLITGLSFLAAYFMPPGE
jgi:hypothetical protein